MIKNFLLKRSRKFLLSIGDEGAVLVYMVRGQVEGRFFFNNVESIDIDKVFASDPDAPIHVIVDVSDQSYLQHSLPPVSSLNLQKMVNRRLEKEFERDDIKGAIFLNRSKTGRRDWNYLFVSIRNVAPLSDWLDKLGGYPNLIAGLYLLPIESEPMVRAIKKGVEAENAKTTSQWQMLVTHNKTGGLRQTVFRDGRILFTRLAQPVGGNAAGVIAGHIEQETLNTLEYIRRMNFEDKDGLDIIIITSSEVKKQLEGSRFKVSTLHVLTPFEVSNLLGFEKASEPKDKFSDIITLAFIGRSNKHLLRLTTPLLAKTRQMEFLRVGALAFTYFFIPIAVLLTIYNIYSSFSLQGRITSAEAELEKVRSEQQTLEKRNAANAEKMAEVDAMVSIYSQFSRDAIVPFGFLSKLTDIKGPTALYKNITFTSSEVQNEKGKNKALQNAIRLDAQIEYPDTSATPQEHIAIVENFAKIMRDALPEFNVNFTGLPSQQNFEISVEGGPTVAGAAPKAPEKKKDEKIGVTINATLNEDLREKFFTLPNPEATNTPATPQVPTASKTGNAP